SATAASSGSDLNGKAAERAALTLKDRLIKFASKHFTVPQEFISFSYSGVLIGNKLLSFSELVSIAYKERVQLSALGFYKTPNIHWDRAKGKGEPFYYFSYGAAVSEVSLDTLTGEYVLNRTDILHDVGQTLNEPIDIGQIEGGFIQGVGWLTSEELFWDDCGRLKTHAPSTYKIPLASDTPETLNISLLQNNPNPRPTVKRSKAVGEPPFMLSISVFEALSMAVSSVIDYSTCPNLSTPATPENLLLTIEKLKRQNDAKRI
ncbi:MAG: molybdopterin cofactor-binding domain-containing protein, partial [Paracoccaceae bacterium]